VQETVLIVHIHEDAQITLDEADTFTAFHVKAPDRTPQAVAALLGSGAYADEGGNVWIPIARLHELGRSHGGAEWRAGCDGMIAFAASKGWVDAESETVRAHLEN
jgi:hypothetical protein